MTDDGPLQLSLFDEQDLAEISSPDFPGERLICCRDPVLAAERARKREDVLATEKLLAPVTVRVAAGKLTPGTSGVRGAFGQRDGSRMARNGPCWPTADPVGVVYVACGLVVKAMARRRSSRLVSSGECWLAQARALMRISRSWIAMCAGVLPCSLARESSAVPV